MNFPASLSRHTHLLIDYSTDMFISNALQRTEALKYSWLVLKARRLEITRLFNSSKGGNRKIGENERDDYRYVRTAIVSRKYITAKPWTITLMRVAFISSSSRIIRESTASSNGPLEIRLSERMVHWDWEAVTTNSHLRDLGFACRPEGPQLWLRL